MLFEHASLFLWSLDQNIGKYLRRTSSKLRSSQPNCPHKWFHVNTYILNSAPQNEISSLHLHNMLYIGRSWCRQGQEFQHQLTSRRLHRRRLLTAFSSSSCGEQRNRRWRSISKR